MKISCSREFACLLPGRTRPGLIEARTSEAVISDPEAGGLFRGVRAPASLKRSVATDIVDSMALLFRGVRAPASLKHDLPVDPRYRLRYRSSGAYAPRPH